MGAWLLLFCCCCRHRVPSGADGSIPGGPRVAPAAAQRPHEEEEGLRRQGAGVHHAGARVQGARSAGERRPGARLRQPNGSPPRRRRVQLQDVLLGGACRPAAEGAVRLPRPQLSGPGRAVPGRLGQRGAHLVQRQRGHHLPPLPAAAGTRQRWRWRWFRDVAPRRRQLGRRPALPAVPVQRHGGAEREAGRGGVGGQSGGVGGRRRQTWRSPSGGGNAGLAGPQTSRRRPGGSAGALGLFTAQEELRTILPRQRTLPKLQTEQGHGQAVRETQLLPLAHPALARREK